VVVVDKVTGNEVWSFEKTGQDAKPQQVLVLYIFCAGGTETLTKSAVDFVEVGWTAEKEYVDREAKLALPRSIQDRAAILEYRKLGAYAEENRLSGSNCSGASEAIVKANPEGLPGNDKEIQEALRWAHLQQHYAFVQDSSGVSLWRDKDWMEKNGYVDYHHWPTGKYAYIRVEAKKAIEASKDPRGAMDSYDVQNNLWVYIGSKQEREQREQNEQQREQKNKALEEKLQNELNNLGK
jgi:hypothetical protein